jgi:hypothetical protein
LSQEDKDDMLKELLPDESLELHVRVWMKNRMPDYANGHTSPYVPQSDKPMSTYRGIGKRG